MRARASATAGERIARTANSIGNYSADSASAMTGQRAYEKPGRAQRRSRLLRSPSTTGSWTVVLPATLVVLRAIYRLARSCGHVTGSPLDAIVASE